MCLTGAVNYVSKCIKDKIRPAGPSMPSHAFRQVAVMVVVSVMVTTVVAVVVYVMVMLSFLRSYWKAIQIYYISITYK